MALLRFTKLPKHKGFNYKPRYWDEAKEELHARVQAAQNVDSDDLEAMKSRISGKMRRASKVDGSFRRTQVRRSNFILLGIVLALLFK